MSLFSRISVGAKLLLLIASAAAGILLVTAISVVGLRQASGQTRSLVAEDFATLRDMGDLRASIGNMRRYEKDLFLNMSEEAALARYHASWAKEVAAGLRLADGLAARTGGDEHAAIERIKDGLAGYRTGVESIVTGIRTGKVNDPWAANQAMEPFKGAVRKADTAFADLTKSVTARVEGREAELEALERRTLVATAAGAAAVILLVAVLALLIGRRIVHPLRDAAAALRRIADGDLTQRVAASGRDEIGHLIDDLARMQGGLVDRVAAVRSGIDGVATASEQIAHGSGDLSARTERQAASLQETAASMQQLTLGVRNSAAHADEASAIAARASAAAAHGGEVVAAVATTMGDIQAASRRIADITGVIDGIAFQTNILALNASVEAARAGEQGRGFAVVAGEVRTLAQRAATAAREIKQLIQETTTRIDACSVQAQEAQRATGEVVAQVRRVDGLIGEMAREAGAQSAGIAQVGEAITSIDGHTQQNAALVEESAAAADSLRQQAAALTRAVEVFRIPASA